MLNCLQHIFMKQTIKQYCAETIKQIIFPPAGILPYHYITPSKLNKAVVDRELGNYTQQYDWDTFFIGVAFSQIAPRQVPYYKEAILNFLNFTTPTGRTPRTISPTKFWDPFDQHKPFLAQGCQVVSETLKDYSWLTGWPYERLEAFLHFWEDTRGFHGLARWRSSLESGPDNNATIVHMDNFEAESCDVNTYLYREFVAMADIAKKLGKDSTVWLQKARQLKQCMNVLWNKEDQTYYDVINFTDTDVEHIRVASWTNFVPLWAGIPSQAQANVMLKRYLLSEKDLLAPYGIRSLSIKNPIYNTAKRAQIYEITEHRRREISNWQGPVWIVSNWIITQGLARYGYVKEAKMIAKRVLKAMEMDLEKTGTLHENYNPETGEGLWSPNFGSWNLLAAGWLATFDS